jgi:hypothetical protein
VSEIDNSKQNKTKTAMFKKILALVVLASVSTVAFAQGTVAFTTVNLGTTAQVFAPGGGLATGAAYLTQLYAAPGTAVESALVAVGDPVNFRTGVNAGYVQQSGTVTTTGKAVNSLVYAFQGGTPGGAATVQLRAWDSTFATYEAAKAASAVLGKSALLTLAATGNPVGSPPSTQVDLIGLTGFTMSGGAVIPEPSSLALMLLGGAALLIRRRK